MNRRNFLGLLGLIGCKDINEDCMNIAKKEWWKKVNSPEQDAVFLIIGDSLAAGAANDTGIGPTTLAETCYESDGATLTELTTLDVSTSTANNGSPWKQFALDYNASTGRKVVLCASGSGGSEFYPYLDNNNWYTSGTLYAAAKTKTDNTLTLTGASLTGILMILGVNDFRGTNSTADIKTGMESLFSRLNTDHPGVPIYVASFGRSETWESSLNAARQFQLKKYLQDTIELYSQARLVTNLSCYTAPNWNLYGVDNLHLTQSGNNKLGTQFCEAVLNNESNQQVANVINQFFTKPTGSRLAAYKTFIEGCQSDGNWNLMDSLFIFKSDARGNLNVPFRGYGIGQDDDFDFNVNESMTVGAPNKLFRRNIWPSVGFNNATQTDFIVGTKILTNLTAAGTEGALFGARQASPSIIIRAMQTVTSVIFYLAHDGTNSSYSEAKFADNSYYAVYRNGTTKGLSKNGSSVASVTQTSTGINTRNIHDGCVNNADTSQESIIEAKLQATYIAKYTGFNEAALQARIDTLLAAL